MKLSDGEVIELLKQAANKNEEMKKISEWLSSKGMCVEHIMLALRALIDRNDLKKKVKLDSGLDTEIAEFMFKIANRCKYKYVRVAKDIYKKYSKKGEITERQYLFLKALATGNRYGKLVEQRSLQK